MCRAASQPKGHGRRQQQQPQGQLVPGGLHAAHHQQGGQQGRGRRQQHAGRGDGPGGEGAYQRQGWQQVLTWPRREGPDRHQQLLGNGLAGDPQDEQYRGKAAVSVLTFMSQGQLTDSGSHALQAGGIRHRHHQDSPQQGTQTVRDQIQQRGTRRGR